MFYIYRNYAPQNCLIYSFFTWQHLTELFYTKMKMCFVKHYAPWWNKAILSVNVKFSSKLKTDRKTNR